MLSLLHFFSHFRAGVVLRTSIPCFPTRSATRLWCFIWPGPWEFHILWLLHREKTEAGNMIDRPMQVTQLLKEALDNKFPSLSEAGGFKRGGPSWAKISKSAWRREMGPTTVLECLNIDLMVFVDAWNLVTLILFNIGAIWWRYIFDMG